MDRSEFLLKLATEKKIAIVSEQVNVIRLEPDIFEKSLSYESNTDSENKRNEAVSPEFSEEVNAIQQVENEVNDLDTASSKYATLKNMELSEYLSPTSGISDDSSSIIPDSEDDSHNGQSNIFSILNRETDSEDCAHSGDDYVPSQSNVSSSSSSSSTPLLYDQTDSSDNLDNNQPLCKAAEESGQQGSHSRTPNLNKTGPEGNTADRSSTREPAIMQDMEHQYIKKPSARERPTLCPICFQTVATHFTRHLFRHHQKHKDVELIKKMKPGSKERLALVSALRKQGYFHLNTEKNVLNPVRTSRDPLTEYFACTYCLGHYSKKLLYRHVKICNSKPLDVMTAGRGCLSRSQTFMASMMSKNHEFLRTSRIRKEVFDIMRPDNISRAAKNDPLICLYGETLLAKHKRQQIATVVSNRIREMARMLIVLKTMSDDIRGLFDVLKPEMFRNLITAAKIISGYDENTNTFKAPSLALHMGTNLKIVCNVAFKIVIEKRSLPNISWDNRDQKKNDIKDLRKLIEGHWCSEISSLALKNLKERQWEKPVQLPLTNDILLFQTYVNDMAEKAYENLENNIDTRRNYKILTECVLALTVMFNRKRVGDVQYLNIETYNKENHRIDQEAFTESLTEVERILSQKFKRVVTGGKGSKPVPILFSKRLQKFIACLLNIRETTNIVPKSNPYMFANPGSGNKWMAGTSIIRNLAKKCGAKYPSLLTSTKFRKHIATTLQLMSMQPEEMEQIATFMGHTKKTHAEFYRLPQDIYQTAKVAKVLLLLEKGGGKEFQGKSLNEIELEKEIYYSSESGEEEGMEDICHSTSTLPILDNEGVANSNKQSLIARAIRTTEGEGSLDEEEEKGKMDAKELPERKKKKKMKRQIRSDSEERESIEEADKENNSAKRKCVSKKQSGHVKWTDKEKRTVLNYFKSHIRDKVTPRKYECDQFIAKHGESMINKDWVRIKTFVYNSFRRT